ncbi:hypothetical protein Nepgr_023201 [Nepenthes gracilis]|uniref:Uncharacterized protein n=1 Tax=Nepenthes gracilis TaxID=150966 RepID=A0AAD3XYT7_NEPGR|nr:hypothetical protein Nepgr_023201 [Nepenthes gracilis]
MFLLFSVLNVYLACMSLMAVEVWIVSTMLARSLDRCWFFGIIHFPVKVFLAVQCLPSPTAVAIQNCADADSLTPGLGSSMLVQFGFLIAVPGLIHWVDEKFCVALFHSKCNSLPIPLFLESVLPMLIFYSRCFLIELSGMDTNRGILEWNAGCLASFRLSAALRMEMLISPLMLFLG